MGSSRRFARQRRFTLDEQAYRMSVAWPGLRVTRKQRQSEIVWVGEIQPTPLSENYTVSIRLCQRWCPEVRVLHPRLKVREGAPTLPHLNTDGSLCLHVEGEWHSGLFVAETTVPWASAWLYFYEVWSATGWWLGGGTHPEKPEHRSE